MEDCFIFECPCKKGALSLEEIAAIHAELFEEEQD